MSKAVFFKGLSFSYIRQIVTIVIGIVSVPMMLNYFGNTLFGIWSLVLGLAMYLNNIAFGIPSAMSTLVAKTADREEKYRVLKKSTFLLSSIVFLLLILFFVAISIDTEWIILLVGNIHQQYTALTKQIFILFIIVTLIKIPLNLYMQFFVGMNLVFIAEIYQTLNIVFGFIALIISIYLEFNLYEFALLTLGFQVALGIASVLHVLLKFHFLQTINTQEQHSKKDILKSGFAFFQVGIAASIVWSTDNLVINHFLSPEYITPYTIAFKMFTYIFIFSAMINGVVGPIYGNAFAQNDFSKINLYLGTILKLLPVLGGGVWFSLLFFSKDVIELWTGGGEAFGGYLLIFSLGFYGYILSFVNSYATLIFSFNYANKTLSIAWAEAGLNFVLSVVLVNFLGIGGVALATALAAFFVPFLFLPRFIRHLSDNKISFDFSFVKKQFVLLVLPAVGVSVVSIFIESFLLKLSLYLIVTALYLFFTWKFLQESDKIMILNILKRKG